MLSDPVSLETQAFDELAVSLYLAGETTVVTQHEAALQSNYVSSAGDYTNSVELPVESVNQSWYLLSGIDVVAPFCTAISVPMHWHGLIAM